MFSNLGMIAVGGLILTACAQTTAPATPPSLPTAVVVPKVRATEANGTSAPASLALPTKDVLVGYLTGHVTIGPLQPVQRAGPPDTPAPQVFASRSIDIFEADGTTRVVNVRIDSDGTYRVTLPSGVYVVALARSGLDRARGLPKPITIEGGKTVQLDVDIDTGIR